MLMRMYLRWGESRGFNAEVIEVSVGDVARNQRGNNPFSGSSLMVGLGQRLAFID